MSPATTAPFRPLPFMARDIELQRRADGVLLLRSRVPLGTVQPHLLHLLSKHQQERPKSTWLAQRRGPEGQWQTLSYEDASRQVDAIAQALLAHAPPGRCVAVLSGNSLEHGVLELAAMKARAPCAPITPAYSLLTQDLSKLQSMIDLLQPAVVFAQNGRQFQRALTGLALPADAVCVVVDEVPAGSKVQAWSDWLSTAPTPELARSLEAITPDTVAKYLFTSGSTGLPKAAIVTQRMLMTSLAMHQQALCEAPGSKPSVFLDWMPWSHVASGNIMFGLTLIEGGELWIDEGRPIPGQFTQTLRNLRDVSPTNYSSVPLGYTMLVEALEADSQLASAFFSRMRRLNYAGAKLPDSIFDRMQAVAVQTTGERIPFVSAFGSTETSAAVTITHWCAESAGVIGLPHCGVSIKLLPQPDERYEVRVKSDGITPGYLHQPEATAAAFDEDGFFRMGDALQFVDPQKPEEGLLFAGRVAEEFKLQSGTFVRVGALRVECIEAAKGLLSDVVLAGPDRAYLALLAWPNLAACRRHAGTPDATLQEIVGAPWLREHLRQAFRAHNLAVGGNSRRIQCLLLMADPPDMGAGEITDKGYVNQRLVLSRRAAQVARLFAEPADPDVIQID